MKVKITIGVPEMISRGSDIVVSIREDNTKSCEPLIAGSNIRQIDYEQLKSTLHYGGLQSLEWTDMCGVKRITGKHLEMLRTALSNISVQYPSASLDADLETIFETGSVFPVTIHLIRLEWIKHWIERTLTNSTTAGLLLEEIEN